MGWMRAHPFAMLFAAAGLAFLLIASLTASRRASVQGPVSAFSAGTIAENSAGSYTTQETFVLPAPQFPAPLSSAAPTSMPKIPAAAPAPTNAPSTVPAQSSGGSTPLLSSPSSSASPADQLLQEVYSLIPSSIPTYGAPARPARTPEQQAFYDWGNQAGLAVLSFDNAHTGMAQVLQAWINNRSSAPDAAAVRQIASDMRATGETLAGLPSVPPEAQAANGVLAQSYKDASDKLEAVIAASTTDDTALVAALKAYDATADTFTKHYVAVADLFSLHEVVFSASDPGSAFQFPSQ